MKAVLEELLEQFRSIAQTLLPSERPELTATSRRLGLSRVLEYLRDHGSSNPSMASLCSVSGLSERTLQVAFQESIGLSPREFMNLRRLHLVRRDLLTADRQTHTVGEVAMEHGFYELGRFAGRYREYFGELPSQTLLRETFRKV